jgi:FkbM family methyltransferase
MNTALHSLALHGLGVLNFDSDHASGERFLIKEYLPSRIKQSDPVFFDVGANVGALTTELLEVFPGASIYSFEPHPQTFLQLQRAMVGRGQVCCNNVALGRQPGHITLYDRSDYSGSAHASVFAEVISDIHRQDVTAVDVRVDTLDSVVKAQGIGYIDYLKIDTEGSELEVLFGGSQLLSEGRIGYIHFEFNEMNVVSKVFLRDFRKLLAGYEFFRLLPQGLLPLGTTVVTTEIFGYQNILAVPPPKR